MKYKFPWENSNRWLHSNIDPSSKRWPRCISVWIYRSLGWLCEHFPCNGRIGKHVSFGGSPQVLSDSGDKSHFSIRPEDNTIGLFFLPPSHPSDSSVTSPVFAPPRLRLPQFPQSPNKKLQVRFAYWHGPQAQRQPCFWPAVSCKAPSQ